MSCFSHLFKRKKGPHRQDDPSNDYFTGSENITKYSYRELVRATSNFDQSNKIGEGGYGPVYKGTLKDGTAIAVKVLSLHSRQGAKEFLNELLAIAGVAHENLVNLLQSSGTKDADLFPPVPVTQLAAGSPAAAPTVITYRRTRFKKRVPAGSSATEAAVALPPCSPPTRVGRRPARRSVRLSAPVRQSSRLAARAPAEFADMTTVAVQRKALLNSLSGCSAALKKHVHKSNILSRNLLPLGVAELRKLVSAAGAGCKNVDVIGVVTEVAE